MTDFNAVQAELNAMPKGTEEEKKAYHKALNAARLEARDVLINNGLKSDDEQVVAAATILKPKAGGGGGGARKGKDAIVMELFEDVNEIDEFELYKQIQMGRPEMRHAIKEGLKKAAAEDRKWISFNPETNLYVLESVGADAPEGWTGWKPVDIEELED